jgi:hypothetical protein
MSNELTVIEQREVTFYDDQLTAVRVASGEVYIPVRPICDLLGVDWNGQRRRINRDPVLSTEATSVDVTSTQGGNTQRRAMICLPLDYISGFLFGINADRVRDDLRDRVIRYQRECYKVLSEAFQEGRLTADTAFDDLLKIHEDTPEVQAFKMLQGMLQLARNQIMIRNQLQNHEDRLETIEAQLSPPAHAVTQSQAMQISQAVKAVAMTLGKQTKRNEFGAVYGELYRKDDQLQAATGREV